MQSANSKIPLGKFAWLILAAVIAAPTAFFLLVTPKEPDEPPAPPVEKRPPSKLESVGLRDYRDWDGLPEMFAVWAGQLEWENNKTIFAYWNPGSQSYSYFFEVARTASGFRFRELSLRECEENVLALLIDKSASSSSAHPFLFPDLVRARTFANPALPLPRGLKEKIEEGSGRPRKVELKPDSPRQP